MILVDTSVWIDHFTRGDRDLAYLLNAETVRMHSAVIGELAMGNLHDRTQTLADLHTMPQAVIASPVEVLHLVETHQLYGRGIGYVDAQLLSAARLNSDKLWARDKRLHACATELGIEYIP